MKTKPKVHLICDLQFGSTGKGLLAGYLANKLEPDTVVSAWAPNAGHTYIDRTGRKFVHRMLPNGVVSPGLKRILLGPGSVIDLDVLNKEIESCLDILHGVPIFIHAHAAYVRREHVDTEKKSLNRIGSTQKGTAAANIEKMMRGPFANIIKNALIETMGHPVWDRVHVVGPDE